MTTLATPPTNVPTPQQQQPKEQHKHYDINAIKERLDIVDVVAAYLPLTQKGNSKNYFAVCPFHTGDNEPSFNVRKDLQFYKCYACGAHGDLIQFIQHKEGIDWYEALKKAADMAYVTGVPASGTLIKTSEKAKQEKPELPKKPDFEWKRLQYQIDHSAKAHEYFASRGIAPELVNAMGIGPDTYASNANWNGVYETLEGHKYHFPKVPYYNMPYTVFTRLIAQNARRDDVAAQRILDVYDKDILEVIKIDMWERNIKSVEARRERGEAATFKWESEKDITPKEMMDKIFGPRFRQWVDAPGPYIYGLENLLALENGTLRMLSPKTDDTSYILITEGEICRLSAMSAVRDSDGNWTGGYRAAGFKWSNLPEKYQNWMVRALSVFTVVLIIEDRKGGAEFSLPLHDAIKSVTYARILRPPEGCNDLNDIIMQGKLPQFLKEWPLPVIPKEKLLQTATVRDYYFMCR